MNDKGHRIGKIAGNSASVTLESTDENVKVDSDKLVFANADAQTYLRDSGEVVVQVSVTDEGNTIKKNETVKYENTAVTPDKAVVKTNAVSIKLDADQPSDEISMKQILFGIGDADQLLIDDNAAIAVKKNAKNAGYKYNQSLVSVTGTDGKVMPLGINLYGTTETEFQKDSSLWNNDFINSKVLDSVFAQKGFDLDVEVSNIVESGSANVTNSAVSVPQTAESSATFTLVVKGIYVEGAAQEKENNLLATPVQLNVSVESAEFDAAVVDARQAEDVDTLITALPSAGTVALGDKIQIEAVRTAYDALTAAGKALVTDYPALEAAEGELAVLEEAKAVLDELTTAKVLVEGNTFTALLEADTADVAAANAAIKAAVEALVDSSITVTIVDGTFTAATAGVNDGSYDFTVELVKAGQSVTTTTKTVVISQ